MNNENIMQYLLIALLLAYGYFCLYRLIITHTGKHSVRSVAGIILFVVYAVISVVLLVLLDQFGNLRMTLMMLLILMSMIGFLVLLYSFLKDFDKLKKLPLLLFILYMLTVSYVCIFSRKEGFQTVILLEFDSVKQAIQTQSFEPLEHLLLNIALFVPIGFLFPAIYPEKLNKISLVFSLGLMLTVLIETVQMMLRLGQCDLEDLAANTIGAILGILCYRLYLRLNIHESETAKDRE